MLRLVVPLVPPSVNSYVRHTRGGQHYKRPEVQAFKDAVSIMFLEGQQRNSYHLATITDRAVRYHVDLKIMLAGKQRLDIDNGLKVVLDALKDCGAIHSDAAVHRLSVSMGRDADFPRTEIEVEVL